MIQASELRSKLRSKANHIAGLSIKPGYYIWYAKRDDFKYIIDTAGYDFKKVKNYLDIKDVGGETYYGIYVGIAVNESLRSRLKLHVCGNYEASTLRRTIAAIYGHSFCNEEETNKVIDRLYVEWEEYSFPIKSAEAKKTLEAKERKLMKSNLYILNIKDNKHDKAQLDTLKKLRSKCPGCSTKLAK